MSADFIETITLPAPHVTVREWYEKTWTTMRAKGATYGRWSFPPDKPDELYVEGWLVRPDDQGPHPWEKT